MKQHLLYIIYIGVHLLPNLLTHNMKIDWSMVAAIAIGFVLGTIISNLVEDKLLNNDADGYQAED